MTANFSLPRHLYFSSDTAVGIRKVLNYIKYRYNDIPVYITENGVGDTTGTRHDEDRINYMRAYIDEVLKGV